MRKLTCTCTCTCTLYQYQYLYLYQCLFTMHDRFGPQINSTVGKVNVSVSTSKLNGSRRRQEVEKAWLPDLEVAAAAMGIDQAACQSCAPQHKTDGSVLLKGDPCWRIDQGVHELPTRVGVLAMPWDPSRAIRVVPAVDASTQITCQIGRAHV